MHVALFSLLYTVLIEAQSIYKHEEMISNVNKFLDYVLDYDKEQVYLQSLSVHQYLSYACILFDCNFEKGFRPDATIFFSHV